MNCLAHLYLSGDDPDLKIGNFIADHVKGKAMNGFPPAIRDGIILHRKIDFYTDTHPVVLRSKERLRPVFRKYSPVIVDIFYDHFLAANWKNYSDTDLKVYAQEFYKLTEKYDDIMPAKTRHMLTYMISGNWLVGYATTEGINRVLGGMSRRTAFESGMENAAAELVQNYQDYKVEFEEFFVDLRNYVQTEIRGNH